MRKTTIAFGLLLGLMLVPFLSDLACAGFGFGLPGVIKKRVEKLDKKVKENNKVEIPSKELIISQTIDTDGGQIEADSLTLTVPAGAFSEIETITVYRSNEPTPMDTYRTSDVFIIEGLPETYSETITITLETTGSSDESYVVLEEGEVFIPSRAEMGTAQRLLEAEVSDNKVTVALPPIMAEETESKQGAINRVRQAPETEREQFAVWAIQGYTGLSISKGTSKLFRICFPKTFLEANAEEILKAALEAYDHVEALGLSWDKRTRWPIEIDLVPFSAADNSRWGEVVPSKWRGLNYYSIRLNVNKLTDIANLPETKISAGHELFHVAQFCYDHRNRIPMAAGWYGTWLWMDEATATWFEHLMSKDPDYIPSTVEDYNYTFIKRSLEFTTGDKKARGAHGYGASMFMKYLADRYGNTVIGDIIKQRVNAETKTPVDAIKSSTSTSLIESLWGLFAEDYMAGTIYPIEFPKQDAIIGLKNQEDLTYYFDSQDDAGTIFKWDAPDLSAHIYTVQFKSQWPNPAPITIKLVGSANDLPKAIIYKWSNTKFSKLTTINGGDPATDLYQVDGKAMVDNGESLVIMVVNARAVNPYTGTAHLELEIKRPPVIDSISPASSPAGTKVTIKGSGFWEPQGTGKVTFGGLEATASVWSETSIAVNVPRSQWNG